MFIPINKVALLLYFNVLYFTARFLKCVWPLFNILHERVKSNKQKPVIQSETSRIFLSLLIFHSDKIALSYLNQKLTLNSQLNSIDYPIDLILLWQRSLSYRNQSIDLMKELIWLVH